MLPLGFAEVVLNVAIGELHLQAAGGEAPHNHLSELLFDALPVALCPLTGKQVEMAVPAAPDHRGDAGFHPFEIRSAPRKMAGITSTVPRAPPEAAAGAAGLAQANVRCRTGYEGGEPSRVFHALPEGLRKRRIGAADFSLRGVELVGARLPLMEGKADVGLWPMRA